MNYERLSLLPGDQGKLWLTEGASLMSSAHTHRELELNLILEGRACYLLPHHRYDLRPRCLVWLFPQQEHILMDRSPDFKAWVVVFRPRLVAQTVGHEPYDTLRRGNPGTDWLRRLDEPATTNLDRLMKNLSRSRDHDAAVTFNAGLHYLLLTAYDHFRLATTLEATSEVHPAVSKAAQLLKHDHGSLNEESIATQVGLSRSHLSRLFRRQTGVPLVEFRNRLRVERFMSLYGAGQKMTMLAAALEAGFGSYAQFYRVFKRVTGISPADHRCTRV